MIKYYLIVLSCLVLVGCEKAGETSGGLNYRIETIEDCEYILFGYGEDFAITHKGNCTNKIHLYNKDF